MRGLVVRVLVVLLVSGGLAYSQGVQTGELMGTVKSPDGQLVPGASVTVKSPSLLASRTVATDSTGAFLFRGLPPGPYAVTFEMNGMATVQQKATVGVDTVGRVDVTMKLASVQETLTVTAEAPSALNTTEVGAHYEKQEIDTLPVRRDPATVAALAPGLSDNTPNGSQVTISGGFAYDNIFLIDGVDVDDNLFGSPQNLFIEDSIDETQVLTSGISAEYGRFSGGVVNIVTKRGGNDFSGSFRTNFSNPTWTKLTPFEVAHNVTVNSNLNERYEATLGGPIVKDKVWFFMAGRKTPSAQTAYTLPDTGIAGTTTTEQKRFEGKVTAALTPNHTVSAEYILNNSAFTDFPFSDSASSGLREIDPRDIFPAGEEPNNLFVATYNGVLSPKLFVEAQYSQRHFEFKNEGGTGTDIVNDSPFFTSGITSSFLGQYNAPYFDASDPENRNNRQFTAAISYFLTTSNVGRHDLKGGWENYRSTRTGGNSQSPTNFVFYDDYVADANGKAILANGRVQPNWVPGVSARGTYLPVKGAQLDITTNSFYVNDKWEINNHFRANLGGRFESVKSNATGGIIGVNTSTWVPRLALSFDPMGDGKWKLNATYAHYAGKYNEAQVGNNTNVGNPNFLYSIYTGPPGQGLGFTPGFDPNNYTTVFGSFPLANVSFAPNLSSPVSKEFTFSVAKALGTKGYAQAVYTHRKWGNFIQEFITRNLGATTVIVDGVNYGTLDNIQFANSDLPERKYDGIQVEGSYRFTDRWNLTANYTRQINNYGNFDGEARNQPAIASLQSQYPEIYVPDRQFPLGNLAGFVPNRIRAWTTYDLRIGGAGDLLAGLLWRYDSGSDYSLEVSTFGVSKTQLANNPGYVTPPATEPLYFGSRGAQHFDGAHLFDLSLTYTVKAYKSVKPYVRFEVLNLFNNQSIIAYNTSISANPNSPLDANGLPTAYRQGRLFGQVTSTSDYPGSLVLDGTKHARTWDFAVGFRF